MNKKDIMLLSVYIFGAFMSNRIYDRYCWTPDLNQCIATNVNYTKRSQQKRLNQCYVYNTMTSVFVTIGWPIAWPGCGVVKVVWYTGSKVVGICDSILDTAEKVPTIKVKINEE